METRPKIQLKLTPPDNRLELASKIALVVLWALALFTFFILPEIIPVHFNAKGQADGYGNKLTLFILPLLGTMIYFGLTKLNLYPHVFNYMVEITEENAQRQYTLATRLLRYLKLVILTIFSFIIVFTYFTTKGVTNGVGVWFLPLSIALLCIPTAIAISQAFKNRII